MSEKERCQGCGAPLRPVAQFCSNCGLKRGSKDPGEASAPRPVVCRGAKRKARQRGFSLTKNQEVRLVATIATCFVGTLAALLFAGYLYDGWEGSELGFEILEGVLLISVGFLGLAILGLRNAEAAFGRRVELRWLGLAPLVGLAGFSIAWIYVFTWSRLLFGEQGAAAEPIPVFSATWLAAVWIAPVAEEWLDRGVLWIACVRANGTTMALWTTSALFALSHGLNGGWLLECPHRMAGGLLLGWLRLRSGSIAAPIVAHATWNLLAVSV